MNNSRGHAWFTLFVLFGINFMNFYDRQILAAVQEKVKAEWQLTDTELGWLGTAFILLYAAIGVPFGHLADVWRRKWLLFFGVSFWSLLTAASGRAWGFWSMFWARLGVGVGEATCAPTCSSLIGDLFPPEKRARAISIFMAGLPLGLAASYFFSARITVWFDDWRYAFYVAAIPGFMLALAVLFALDPIRGSADKQAKEQPEGEGTPEPAKSIPFTQAVGRILRRPTMWWIIASGALHNFNMYALGGFLVSVLMRYHGQDIKQANDISTIVHIVGAIGMFMAGWVGDWAYRKRTSGRLVAAWIALAIAGVSVLLALNAPQGSAWGFAGWMLPAYVMLFAYYGTVYASIQDIIEPALRGTAMALYFFAMYFLGAILGPVATGWISNTLALRAAEAGGVDPAVIAEGRLPVAPEYAEYHATGLHQAMYIIPILCTALVLVLMAASLTVTKDRQRMLQGK